MNQARIITVVSILGLLAISTPPATAQLTEFKWNNPALVGSQSWQVNGNWDMTGFPNDSGRVDGDATVITPSIGANTSVALTGNLTLDVGATNVTVASLKVGGTAGAVTTDIASTGGKLVFENYELNNTTASPQVCAFDCGAALVTSAGVAGSTNIISAPVQINGERLEFSAASTNNITLSGPITFANLTGTGQSSASIRSFMPTGTKVTVSGSVSLVDTVTTAGALLTLNDSGSAPPNPPTTTTIQSNPAIGTLEISGVIQDTAATTGSGTLSLGTTTANQALGTIILSGANTFRGRTTQNRVNLVLANDSALGVDSTLGNDRSGGAIFSNGNPSGQFGFNLLSDNDARTLTVDASFAQWETVTGTNSLTWAGLVTQSNQRGWVNILPAGKTLTINGVTFGSTVSSTDTSFQNRIFTYDGTGTTVVTGGWRDKIKGGAAISDGTLGHFRKAGTGTVIVSDPGNVSDFTGDVIVDQGVMRFSNSGIFNQARYVTSTGGAIGVEFGDDGVTPAPTFSNTTLHSKLDAMGPGLKLNHGGLMLTAGESAAAIDFTGGTLAPLANMSVAAPQTGITYTGIITPAPDTFTAVDTYRLGGGNGVLTLPNAQLTGTRNVQVTNGGEVQLNGANTYSGVTRIQAKYHSTVQDQAIANTTTNVSGTQYEGTTLTVNTLLNGGLNSSIGNSSSAASNVIIQGSTLKYVGTGSNGTTNRLFTVGTGGATLDASGASGSAMNFTNGGAVAMGLAGSQTVSIFDTGTAVSDGVSGTINTRSRVNVQQVDDLVNGMTVIGSSGVLAAGPTITAINNPNPTFQNFQVTIGTAFTSAAETETATFGGVARTLTLAGSNTDNNTVSPLIANATAAAGTNTVNVAKNGTGKWILTGNNTYTGTTNVNAGTLLINGTQSGNGLTTVAAGATLGGTGTLGGALTNNGTVNPGASVGTLNVNGNTIMGANSHLAIELSGASADKLAITGNLDLSALANLLDVTGVGTGSSWVIATYTGTLTGTFETITPGYSVDYGSGSNSQVTLMAAAVGLPGDFNNDGKVDAGDYVTWRKNNGTNNALANDNGLGTPIGQAHYNLWRNNFGKPPGAGSSLGAGAVPEPSSIVLIGVALMVTIWGVRRRS
jgi:fibronectin-binding autotransporter adhesin